MDKVNIYGDIFSKVYNLYWNSYISDIQKDLIKFCKKYNHKGRVLDLCCGTGRLSKYFIDAGFSVIGLDLSINMLNEARRKFKMNENIEFIQADAKNFTLEKPVNFVISTFDSLNHFNSIDELQQCFNSVYRNMKSGYFIFDLNTEYGLKSWNFVDVEDNDDTTFIMYGKYIPQEKRAYTRVTGFHRIGELYNKFNEVMINTCYPIKDVLSSLETCGFVEMQVVEPEDFSKVIQTPEKEERVMIIAKKV